MGENERRPYTINAVSIYLYKSSRKNAVCSDSICVNHLITHDNNKRVSDNRILMQFAGTLEKIVYTAAGFNNHLEVSAYMDIGKNTQYINADKRVYVTTEPLRYYWHRVKFSSIEQAVNFLYGIYCLIYPYNTLNLENTVYQDSSIKYLINLYYKGINQ